MRQKAQPPIVQMQCLILSKVHHELVALSPHPPTHLPFCHRCMQYAFPHRRPLHSRTYPTHVDARPEWRWRVCWAGGQSVANADCSSSVVCILQRKQSELLVPALTSIQSTLSKNHIGKIVQSPWAHTLMVCPAFTDFVLRGPLLFCPPIFFMLIAPCKQHTHTHTRARAHASYT